MYSVVCACLSVCLHICRQNIPRTEPDIISKFYRELLWYKSTNPIDFEKFANQDGRKMTAILKNTKTTITSLIMLRFSPFFFLHGSEFQGLQPQTLLQKYMRKWDRARSTIMQSLKNTKIAITLFIFAPRTQYKKKCLEFYKDSNDAIKSNETPYWLVCHCF